MTVKDPSKADIAEMEVASGVSTPEEERKGDYSGAVAKTEPAEIALCRKLDRRVLPVLWVMYYLYGTSAFGQPITANDLFLAETISTETPLPRRGSIPLRKISD